MKQFLIEYNWLISIITLAVICINLIIIVSIKVYTDKYPTEDE